MDRYREAGLNAVAINILDEKRDQVAPWMQSRGYRIPALVGADLASLGPVYGITGAPETMLLDASNRVYYHHVGYHTGEEDQIEAEVRLMLGLPPFEEPAG